MIGSFLRGIQGNEWSHFMDYLSPVFFEVVPALDIARQTTQLGKTYVKLKHPEEEAIVRSLINDMRLPVNFRMDKASSEMLTSLSKQGKGRILLSLYFGQLMHNPLAWIDLRSSTFEWLSKECNWKPGAWIVRWDETFLNAMRKVYRGYYLADDALYLEGLAELQLEHSADLFRKQFGDGSQKAVQFKMKDFRDSFHQIFLSCKRNKTSLHPNFFAFGLFLSSLYEHLESLGESFNVREIFVEVLKARSE